MMQYQRMPSNTLTASASTASIETLKVLITIKFVLDVPVLLLDVPTELTQFRYAI